MWESLRIEIPGAGLGVDYIYNCNRRLRFLIDYIVIIIIILIIFFEIV